MFYILFPATITSTNGIFRQGEMQSINLSALVDALASCDMGIVEVLDA
jgi:hypothetical protein